MSQRPTGPACGNNPNYPMSEGDRQAVEDFKAYLAERAALRDRIAEALGSLQGTAHHLPPETRQRVIEAVTGAALPAPTDRAAMPSGLVRKTLRRWAYAAGHIESELDDAVSRMYEQITQDVLRRMAAEAQPCTEAPPADPWSVTYHRLSPAQNNPAVCICGLGSDAVVHNEPHHRFNARTKPGQVPVWSVCTDCHHHKTSACHAANEAQQDGAQS